MTVKRKVITTVIVVIIVAALCFGGIFAYKKFGGEDDTKGKVFVNKVSECSAYSGFVLNGNKFSGIVESQKTQDVKYDSNKKIKEIHVKEGDTVKKGDKLFTYDVESMQLELEQGEVEIERLNNEIDTNKKQIEELEKEKKSASADNQVTYTTQIQSLNTDISKAEYDIKAKQVELDKLKKSIKNASVSAPMDGSVKKVTDPNNASSENQQDEYYEGSDNADSANVVVTIMASGNYRVKGTINEQNISAINQGTPLIVRSRIDNDVTWNGTVTDIGTEPEQNNNDMMYGGFSDEESTTSNYPFYVELDNTENLMLGQHLILELDMGQDSEKSGLWLYNDYVVDLNEAKPYVWAANSNDKIEKRYVTIGEIDDENGTCEIKSGLSNSDLIAYPSSNIKEGQAISTNEEDANYEDGLNDLDMNGGDFDGGDFDGGNFDGGDFDGTDGMGNDGDTQDGDGTQDDQDNQDGQNADDKPIE